MGDEQFAGGVGGSWKPETGPWLPIIIPYEDGLADFFVWSWGGGVRYGSGYRLNDNLFTATTYDDDAGSPFGWTETDWSIDDGTAVPVADRTGSTADPSPYAGSGCPGGTGTFAPSN